MDQNAQARMRQFEVDVIDFLTKQDGFFFVLSNDNTFYKNLRMVINKHLMIGSECSKLYLDASRIIRDLNDAKKRGTKPLLFIERIMQGRSTTDFIRQLRTVFPEVLAIVITSEVEKEKLILLHEIGVTNYIIKPISVNNLIEKIAFTVKPQGRFGQLIDEGKQLLMQGDFRQAYEISEQILALKRGSPAGLMLRGDALRGMGEKERAVAAYEGAHKSASMFLDPIKKLADFYRDESKENDQLVYLEKLDKLSPLNVERKVDIGRIHVNNGNTEKAEQVFEAAIKLANREAQAMVENVTKKIADICLTKSPELSERFYRLGMNSRRDMFTKDDIETFNSLGIALRKQKKYAEALAEYDKALKVSPSDENLYYNKAMVYVDAGDNAKAWSCIEIVLKLNRDFADEHETVLYNIGAIAYKAGRNDVAREFFRKAAAVAPDSEDVRQMLALLG